MLSLEDDQDATELARQRVRDLAPGRGWLQAVLDRQDRILVRLASLERSQDATSWARHWAVLERDVQQLFALEDIVLAPAVRTLGLRTQAVAAEMCRHRVVHDVADLRWPSWQDGAERARQLHDLLSGHFARERANSYGALARQDAPANAALTLRCEDVFGEPDDRGADAPEMNGR